jgi:hypothetical protein
MNHFKLNLDGDLIRFTPDGKIAVVDAIKALSGRQDAECIWERIKEYHPEFKHVCERYKFQEDQMDVIVGAESWKKIEDALLNFILDPCQVA